LCRGQTVKSGMRADKIVKEEKNRDKIVGGIERGKSLFGFVPRLELLVKAFDQVVGNIIAEALDPDMFHAKHCFYRRQQDFHISIIFEQGKAQICRD
jgi:hypothetical protein